MNRIAIIGAMEEEVAILKEKLQGAQVTERAGMQFYEGHLSGKQVVVVRCGIGKVNAGICVQILADIFKTEAIINTGIAGSLDARINMGDLVISSDALQHDMDAREFGYERGQIPRMAPWSFPADAGLIKRAEAACRKANPQIGVFVGRVVTGDQFIASAEKKEEIRAWTGGLCTEMEGAAIAQGAYLNRIPFVIVRAISDKADNSAVVDYPAFEKQAILHSVRLVEELLGCIF